MRNYIKDSSKDFIYHIAELRHLYQNLVIKGEEEIARYLLGPRIEFFTDYWEKNLSPSSQFDSKFDSNS